MKSYVVTEIDYHELEELVRKNYPELSRYSFVATEECGNDSYHLFQTEEISDEEWNRTIGSALNDGQLNTYCNYLLFNKLCKDGHLSPGKYLVRVSW